MAFLPESLLENETESSRAEVARADSMEASQLVNVTLRLAYVFISPGLTVVGIDYRRPSLLLLPGIAAGG